MANIVAVSVDCSEVMETLNKLTDGFDDTKNGILDALSGIARDTMANEYSKADLSNGNTNAVLKEVERTDDGGRKIEFVGEDAIFIEFGAGLGATHPEGSVYGYTPGSWSSSDKGSGVYAKKGFWYYGRKKYDRIPAIEGAYKATAKVETEFKSKVDEVFKL